MLDVSPHLDPPSQKLKVTRADWLDAAREALTESGVDHVKILTLAARIGVSRSSFYWFFTDRADLLARLVEAWRATNTKDIVEHARKPSRHIVDGVLNVFECWTDQALFNPRLDFAVRDWARRDLELQGLVTIEDETRVEAIAALFRRHRFADDEALVRARVLYFMQMGYYAFSLQENLEQRLRYTAEYIYSFTGVHPDADDVDRFHAFARGSR